MLLIPVFNNTPTDARNLGHLINRRSRELSKEDIEQGQKFNKWIAALEDNELPRSAKEKIRCFPCNYLR